MTAFRTIREVAELLDTPAHVLRFWESRFPQVRPVKRAGGRRYYRPADVALLAGIRKLLHDEGLAIRGVQKMLRDQGVKAISVQVEPQGAPDAVLPMGEDMTSAEAPGETVEDAATAPAELGAESAPDLGAEGRGWPPAPAEGTAPEAGMPENTPTQAAEDEPATPAEAPMEVQPPEAAPAPDEPPRPRVLMRRRAGGDPPGLFSLMDAPEQPRPAPAQPVPPVDVEQPADEDAAERPVAALLRAADPARLAPRAEALAALHARLEAIRARRDCAGRGR